ncbi:MAG: ShlB/FhaC/HecB family hemolysin secretion/activation protein [Candidatus Eremiobacteraeota bacterium]|nr:ShlB/FhaC/HecB family hemolysin secretion/activation protein [Candidatus Eremiobacteraeota bacterium]
MKIWLGHIALLLWLLAAMVPALAQDEPEPMADPPEELSQPAPRLTVKEIVVVGNTLLPEADIRQAVAPYEGRELEFDELTEVVDVLEELYHQKGYFLMRAILPAQKPLEGKVEVQVFEGRIMNVVTESNQRYPDQFLIDHFQAHLPDSGYKQADFQKALMLLNEMPDLGVKAVFRPGSSPGSTEIVLQAVEDKQFHLGLDYNNFGTRLTGENRIGLTGDLSSAFTPGDRLLARSVFGFPSENTAFVQAAYSFPVGDLGTRLGFAYANGTYTAGREVAILDIRGAANVYSLSVEHPLVRSLTHSSDVFLNLSYNDIDNTILGLPLSNDFYTAANLGYRASWRDTSGRSLLRSSVTQGLGGLVAGDPRASRAGAGADFFKANLDLARIQEFNPSVFGILRGTMQYSGTPLFSAEQFALGGPDTVRGFGQAEALGDQAYNLTAELRWSPLEEQKDLFQTVFFVDTGGIVRKNPQPGEKGSVHLTGAGFGFRVNPDGGHTRIRLDLGFPITPARNARGNSPVIYGQVQTRF